MSSAEFAMNDEEAMELLAYLVASADCCLREPPDYGEYRLIMAAYRLAKVWRGRCSEEETARFLDDLIATIPDQAAQRDIYPERFMAFLGECNAAVAQEIQRRAREEASA